MIKTRKPLARVGKRGKELQAIRDKAWPIVRRNAGYKCEGCGAPERRAPMQYAHAFGRNGTGAGLGNWGHVPELAFELCASPRDKFGGCHRRFDTYTDAPLRVRLERLALSRFVKAYGGKVKPMYPPIDNIRELVRALEAAGQQPDGEEVVRESPARHK